MWTNVVRCPITSIFSILFSIQAPSSAHQPVQDSLHINSGGYEVRQSHKIITFHIFLRESSYIFPTSDQHSGQLYWKHKYKPPFPCLVSWIWIYHLSYWKFLDFMYFNSKVRPTAEEPLDQSPDMSSLESRINCGGGEVCLFFSCIPGLALIQLHLSSDLYPSIFCTGCFFNGPIP